MERQSFADVWAELQFDLEDATNEEFKDEDRKQSIAKALMCHLGYWTAHNTENQLLTGEQHKKNVREELMGLIEAYLVGVDRGLSIWPSQEHKMDKDDLLVELVTKGL